MNLSRHSAPVQPGDILADKYRVEHILGKGGMGVVVAARDLTLERRVAVKFMLPKALADDECMARFHREAKAAIRLRSEHVARVLDVGLLQDGAPYIVMDLLEGTDLRALLKQRGRLLCDEAATYVMQACEAVAEAHAFGMVHRDLKPTNLFLTYTPTGKPCVKVLDFGIVKSLDGEMTDVTLTREQASLGSPRFMAPEQVANAKNVDRRSDVWALGACLYQFVTGQPPFVAQNLLELGARIVHEAPPHPSSIRPDIPQPLVQIILCCLEKDPELRFSDARQLGIALEEYLGIASPTSPSSAPNLPTGSSSSASERLILAPVAPPPPPSVNVAVAPTSMPPRAEETGPSKVGTGRVAWGTNGEPKNHSRTIVFAFGALGMLGAAGVGLLVVALLARRPPPTDVTLGATTTAPTVTASAAASPAVTATEQPITVAAAAASAAPLPQPTPETTPPPPTSEPVQADPAKPSSPPAPPHVTPSPVSVQPPPVVVRRNAPTNPIAPSPPPPPPTKPASSRAFDHL